MPPLAREIRYAWRAFLRTPGFTLAAVLSLAIGVGANTAIFSVASALLLRPLPYTDADRLVILWNRSPGLGITEDWFSTAQYFDLKRNHHGFERACDRDREQLQPHRRRRAGADRHDPRLVEPAAAAGRSRRARDALRRCRRRPGRTGTAVLHYGTWMRRYGGDPQVIGRSITLNGQPFEIIGVLAAVVLAAPRGHADARRRGGCGDPAAVAARGQCRRAFAIAKTTTSSAG